MTLSFESDTRHSIIKRIQCNDELIVTSLVVVHRHIGGSQDLGQGLLPQGGVKLTRVPPAQSKVSPFFVFNVNY